MDRKIVLYLLGAAVLGFVGVLMMPSKEPDDGVVRLPWLVSVDSQGQTRVFGFAIGETTLADIRAVFGEKGKINLFSHEDRENRYSAEAYFDQIYLNGLRSDFVITIDADQSELKAMYDRGLRISQLGSGGKKVELSPVDIEVLSQQPIRAITYLPWTSLNVEILKNRFGKPNNTRTEESGVVHWLYPGKGMDIALAKDGGTVIQYVNPVGFIDLIAPLKGPSQHAYRPGNLPRAGH
jgi:hypothetical protein